jgi:hypothetical protein
VLPSCSPSSRARVNAAKPSGERYPCTAYSCDAEEHPHAELLLRAHARVGQGGQHVDAAPEVSRRSTSAARAIAASPARCHAAAASAASPARVR